MGGDRIRQAAEVAAEALERPTEGRGAFVTQACRGDQALRSEVESLLGADAAAGSFLDRPAVRSPGEVGAVPEADLLVGAQIDGFRVVRRLAMGGMGAVYEAQQDNPRRRVALKVIRAGAASCDSARRFEHEAHVLARLQHPGIAQIFEAGSFDRGQGMQPFFAMELIEGLTLTAFAEVARLDTRRRLELFARICDAVHYAHQRGVIHRDLKPGNVLVGADGGPKILDFGVARVTAADVQATTLHTHPGELMGTVPYMSPEQVLGDADQIDIRSDVYALGVMLYELLSGELPHDLRGKAIPEAVRIIREEEITPLSSVNRIFRGDLETVAAKALDRDPERRYQSAAELAADVRRYLNDEPITARPASAMYQLRKFARRNKPLMASSAAILVVLLAGATVSMLFAIREARARRTAEERLDLVSAAEARSKAEAVRAGQVAAFLQSMLDRVRPESAMGADTTLLRLVLDDAASRVDTELAEYPDVEASIRTTIGVVYQALGVYTLAEPHLETALETRRHVLGGAHPDTLTSFNNMGSLLQAQGKLTEAEPYNREALEGRRRVLGDEHPDTLTSIYYMGSLLRDQGKLAEAEPYCREALEVRRRVLGDEHPDTLASIGSMAVLLKAQGKLAEAEPYYREALEVRRRVLGDAHPDTLISIGSIASLLQAQGKFAEAEPYAHEAMGGFRRVLGDEHPDTLISINNIGHLLQVQGKLAEAEPYWRDALEGFRRVLGDDHLDTLTSIHNMGFLLQAQGKLAEAEPYLREALEGSRRVLGDDHPDTLSSISAMGDLLQAQGKLAEAEPYHREALEGSRRVLGDDHPLTLILIRNMGSVLQAQGKLAEAEPYYREALEGSRRVLGDAHPDTLISIGSIASLLQAQGKFAEAEPSYREALEGHRRVLGDEHRDTLKAINNMGSLLRDQGRLAEAESYGREAVERARRVLPESHWLTGVFLFHYGRTLAQLERREEAEAALLEAHQLLSSALGAGHERTIKVIDSLVALYGAWGGTEQAAEWRAKLPKPQESLASN